MKTKEEVLKILSEYIPKVKAIYGEILNKVILYGSYARGDYHEESDIDVMILLDVPPENERLKILDLMDVTCDTSFKNDFIDIQPVTKSLYTFKKWGSVLPFYSNVSKEGLILYER